MTHLISTIPRSGTWRTKYVLACYFAETLPDLTDLLTDKHQLDNINGIVVCHANATRQAPFPLPGYNYGDALKLEPIESQCFIYRERESQLDSYWRHTREHHAAFPTDKEEFFKIAGECYDRMYESWTYSNYFNKDALKIPYEDVLKNPIQEYTRILHNTGRTVDTNKLRAAIAHCSLDNIKAAEIKANRSMAGDTTRIHHATT